MANLWETVKNQDFSKAISELLYQHWPGPRFFVYVIKSSMDSTTSATVRYSRMPLHTRIILRTCNNDRINQQKPIEKQCCIPREKWLCKHSPPPPPPPVNILCNYTLIMLPTDIPASLSCFTPALCGLLESPLQHRAIPELHWKTWWHQWLMTLLTAADSAGTPDVCSQRADLRLFFFILLSMSGKERWAWKMTLLSGSRFRRSFCRYM